MGIGEDGHIASLFPGTAAVHNNTDLYVSNEVNIITKWRVTATYKLLTQVEKVYFLVTTARQARSRKDPLLQDSYSSRFVSDFT